MKRMVCALLCGVLLTTLSACGGEEQDSTETKNPEEAVTFTDDLGREVTLAKPRRVAALIGSFADVWCLAGGQGTLMAAADGDWENGLFFCGAGAGAVNTMSTVRERMEQIMREWRSAQ